MRVVFFSIVMKLEKEYIANVRIVRENYIERMVQKLDEPVMFRS